MTPRTTPYCRSHRRSIRKRLWFLFSAERELRIIIQELDEFAYVSDMLLS